MELNKKNTKKLMWLITFTVLLLVGTQKVDVVINTIYWIIGILQPFIIGGCIAFILSVPMKQFENKVFRKGKSKNRILEKIRRPLSILLSILCVSGIVFIVSFLIIPELGATLDTLIFTTIPQFVEDVSIWVEEMIVKYPDIEQYFSEDTFDWANISNSVLEFVNGFANGVLNSAINIIGSIVSTVANVVIGFVFAVYILFNKEKLAVQGRKLIYSFLPIKRADRMVQILHLTNKSFSSFISGQCVEAVIEGFLFFVVLSIFRFPYAMLIGVLCAFTALIPIFGAFIGSMIGALLIFMVSPIQALWFVVIFLVLQQVESNLIYPHVVGGTIGLPSIWVLFAVTIGGSLMGLIGMLVFIPLFSVFYTLVKENVKVRLLVRRVPEERYMKEDINIGDELVERNEIIRKKNEELRNKSQTQKEEEPVLEAKIEEKVLEKEQQQKNKINSKKQEWKGKNHSKIKQLEKIEKKENK